jgi:hypothetical protein
MLEHAQGGEAVSRVLSVFDWLKVAAITAAFPVLFCLALISLPVLALIGCIFDMELMKSRVAPCPFCCEHGKFYEHIYLTKPGDYLCQRCGNKWSKK